MYVKKQLSMVRSFSHIAAPVTFLTNPTEVLQSKLASVLRVSLDRSVSVVQQGYQVHAQFILNGLENKLGVLGSRILGIYVLSGSFVDARNMFDRLDLRYASPWNWMIRGFTIMGYFDFALLYYLKMLGYGTCPDKYTFPCVIKACAGLRALGLCRSIHEMISLMGFEMDVYVGSSLINLYSENGCLDEARCLFDQLPQRDDVLWNVILNGYAKNGDSEKVIELFTEMRNSEVKPNSVTYSSVLSVCGSESLVRLGTQLHGLVIRFRLEMDSLVANTLIAMYSKCCCLSDARQLFDAGSQADLVTWNGMIGGYVHNGFVMDAVDLFHKMISDSIKPDSVTFSSFLPSVSESASLNQGKEIHGYIVRHGVHLDVFLKNALIDMYFKCRDVEMACNVFNHSSSVDVVMCTAMISGYVLNGMNINALETFRWLLHEQMKPTAVTFASVLPAFSCLAALRLGKELHGNILKNGFEGRCYVGSAVTDLYAKCGRLDLAHQVFMSISKRDAVCWNSMITAFSQNGKPEEAISLFRQMGTEGAKYNCVSISAVLSACANLPAFHSGKEIHGFMMRGGFSYDVFVESALIDMYAKCGNLDKARQVFDFMHVKSEVSWNSIIAAYGNHGLLNDCLALFNTMIGEGFQPDHVTFLAILSACAHAGQVDAGNLYFNCMKKEYGITPQTEHYACIVDLFGRAGLLKEAFQVIQSMPFNPDAGIWGTLLGASRIYGNVEFSELASRHLIDLDPQNSGYYVLLSNVHADAGKWEGVLKARSMMKERGVQKICGYSWIELKNETHIFVASDTNHPDSARIYLLLKNLLAELRREGYVPQLFLPTQLQTTGT